MRNYLGRVSAMILVAMTLLVVSCKKDDVSPSVGQVSPALGPSNTVLTVTGAGLKNIRSIMFDKDSVEANFATTFNTDGAIVFRVPNDAVPGEQNIVFTNAEGKTFTTPFNVLGFATITSVSDYGFKENGEITLTGKNLDDVTEVVFTGTTATIEVVSKTATTLTLKFPATTLSESTLTITNAAGSQKTTQQFIALDNAFAMFTDDYQNGYQDASWGPSSVSTTVFRNGTASKAMTYGKGAWAQDGFGWTTTDNAGYKALSFWIKGGTKDYTLYIWSSAQPGTFNTFDDFKKILVPANVWTHFRIDVASLKLWGADNATAWNQWGWRIQGPDDNDETFYVDDVVFTK